MSKISYDGKTYVLNVGESILDCLLRHGVDYPHSCKSGTCQSCLSRTTQVIDPAWQIGLQPTLATQGYFLSCVAHPSTDIDVLLPNTENVTIAAKIIEIYYLNHNVLLVALAVPDLQPWTAGKYLNLVNSNGDIRSYSIANLPEQDGYIELHIKLMPLGCMSTWLSTDKIGADVYIRGPIGNCFYYNPTHEQYPMILAGTGTGVAPLVGIARDAINQKHQGEIYLLHGGITEQDLYLDDKLVRLAKQHSNFHYERCTLEKSNICQSMPIEDLLLNVLKLVANPKLYVCGPEEFTKKFKMKAFLAGVASKNIYSDAFITKADGC